MNKSISISTDCDNYRITALVNPDGSYYMPCLEFLLDGKCVDIWDNVFYLQDTLYPYLKDEIADDKLDEIFSYVKADVLEIVEEAIKMGIL